MPVNDWQFWVVTVICVIGAAILLRPFFPLRASKRGGGAKRQKRVQLTIEKKRL